MNAGIAIREILINTAAVTALVGTKISPMVGNQTEQLPIVTFQQISAVGFGCKSATGEEEIRLQLNVFAKDYKQLYEIKQAVKTALNGFSGTSKGVVISKVRYDSGRDLYSEPGQAYGLMMDFKLIVS